MDTRDASAPARGPLGLAQAAAGTSLRRGEKLAEGTITIGYVNFYTYLRGGQ
jgi:hypothetical protein